MSRNSFWWELHSTLEFCRAAFEHLLRSGRVDMNAVRKNLPKVKRFARDTWKHVLDSCVACSKPMRRGTGLRTKKGWRIHKRCARKKGTLS